jgi:hypothetical protein
VVKLYSVVGEDEESPSPADSADRFVRAYAAHLGGLGMSLGLQLKSSTSLLSALKFSEDSRQAEVAAKVLHATPELLSS